MQTGEQLNLDLETGEITEAPKLTAAKVVEMLIPVYTEIALLQADAKGILAGAKEAGLPHTLLGKIAKAKAQENLQDLEETTTALLDLIEQVS